MGSLPRPLQSKALRRRPACRVPDFPSQTSSFDEDRHEERRDKPEDVGTLSLGVFPGRSTPRSAPTFGFNLGVWTPRGAYDGCGSSST